MCTVAMHAVNTLTLSTESSTNVLSFCSHSTQGHAVKLMFKFYISYNCIISKKCKMTALNCLKPGLPSPWALWAIGSSFKV